MASSKKWKNLYDKRILVTYSDEDPAQDVFQALINAGACVILLVDDFETLSHVITQYPEVVPILLDTSENGDKKGMEKVVKVLPTMDHIVNLTGDLTLDLFSRMFRHFAIQEMDACKGKHVVKRILETGAAGTIFNVSFGNKKMLSKLKSSFNPRVNDSAASQVTNRLQRSFRKLFKNENNFAQKTQSGGGSSEQNEQQDLVGTANTFKSLASNLSRSSSQNQNQSSASSPQSSRLVTPQSSRAVSPPLTPCARAPTADSEKNRKFRKHILKLHQTTCIKNWKSTLKLMEKREIRLHKQLSRQVEVTQNQEKAAMLNSNNSATTTAFSAETAERIQQSKINRADREVRKKAEKRLEQGRDEIQKTVDSEMGEKRKKLYLKCVDAEVKELKRLVNKYSL